MADLCSRFLRKESEDVPTYYTRPQIIIIKLNVNIEKVFVYCIFKWKLCGKVNCNAHDAATRYTHFTIVPWASYF